MAFGVIQVLVSAACTCIAGHATMHLLQSERYQIPALRKDMRQHSVKLQKPDFLIGVLIALADWYLPMLLSLAIQQESKRETLCNYLVLAVFVLVTALNFFVKRRIPKKKAFGLTRRMCRLMAVNLIINLAIAVLLSLIRIPPYLLFGAAEYTVLLAAVIMRPLEEKINAGFYRAAAEKLEAYPDLIRIGITGSYGKTSVKLILKTLLSAKYRVLSTPPSFSTAMGISRVVNEQLDDEHQVFIAEMGAQQRGEIADMAKLVKPQYAVITNAGSAHIDSFGSVDKAAQAKFELIEALPEDGCAFFGFDGGFGDRLYAKCRREKYRAAYDGYIKSDIHVEGLENGVNGANFVLVTADGQRQRIKTRLLGSYNARNIALCAAVAMKLGMTLDEIAKAAAKIKPVNHSLKIIEGDIYVIDDSANTLPESAAEALRVLSHFPGRRILVTAGLRDVEEDTEDINFAFGTQISEYAERVILLDKEFNAEEKKLSPVIEAVKAGISGGKPGAAVHIAKSEAELASMLRGFVGKGDTVLYEGVLPVE